MNTIYYFYHCVELFVNVLFLFLDHLSISTVFIISSDLYVHWTVIPSYAYGMNENKIKKIWLYPNEWPTNQSTNQLTKIIKCAKYKCIKTYTHAQKQMYSNIYRQIDKQKYMCMHIRHETPVLDHPIKIIHIDNDLVVLDKPSSVPVSSWQNDNSQIPFLQVQHSTPAHMMWNTKILKSSSAVVKIYTWVYLCAFVVVIFIVWIEWRAKTTLICSSFILPKYWHISSFETSYYFIPFNREKKHYKKF